MCGCVGVGVCVCVCGCLCGRVVGGVGVMCGRVGACVRGSGSAATSCFFFSLFSNKKSKNRKDQKTHFLEKKGKLPKTPRGVFSKKNLKIKKH